MLIMMYFVLESAGLCACGSEVGLPQVLNIMIYYDVNYNVICIILFMMNFVFYSCQTNYLK